MREFELADEDVLLAGNHVLVILDAFGAYRGRGEKVLQRYLVDSEEKIEPHGQYPLKRILRGLRDLRDQFGPGFLNRVGRNVFQHAKAPPGLDSFEAMMAATDAAYKMNHVNAEGKIGSYEWTQLSDRSGKMACDNPYPCAFDEGLIEGVAKMFGVELTIAHEDETTCRQRGGELCTYLLEW